MAKRKATGRKRKAARKITKPRARASTRKRPRAAKATPKRAARRAATSKRRANRPATAAAASAKRRAAPKRKTAMRAAPRPKPVGLERERRRLTEEDVLPSAPSTLGYSPKASSAESGHQMYHQRQREHTEGGSALTGGDVDSNWSDAYASGEETPGGDMPTPDQDVVEEIGRALGIEYEDAEELKGAAKVEERDRHRWEYDPASSEDYNERNRKQ